MKKTIPVNGAKISCNALIPVLPNDISDINAGDRVPHANAGVQHVYYKVPHAIAGVSHVDLKVPHFDYEVPHVDDGVINVNDRVLYTSDGAQYTDNR